MRFLVALILLLAATASASCPDPMAFRALGSNSTTAAQSSYTNTAAYTPGRNNLLLAAVVNSKASAPDTPTFSGNGLVWEQVLTTNYNTVASPTCRLTIFRAQGSLAAFGSGVATFSAAQTGCAMFICELTNCVIGARGSNAIRQIVWTNSSGANPSLTLAALSGTSNSVVAFFANDANGFGGTPKAGWTEDYDAGYNTPATGLYTEHRLATTDNAPSVTMSSGNWAGVALEIKQEICPGTVAGAYVDTNGWSAAVTTINSYTNGTYDLGWGTNNSVDGNQNLIFTLTSLGYGDTGQATTITRTIYGTKQLRFAATNNAYSWDEIDSSGTNTLSHYALSDYIYVTDSNINAFVGTGLYEGAPFNNTNFTAIGNRSLAISPKPISNWSWPGYNLISGNTMTLRAVGFHRDGRQGRPLRAMRFVARGQTSSVAVTNWQTTMTATKDPLTGITVSEYVGNLDISGMTQGEDIRCDFTAYPWVGTNTLDTMDNVNVRGPYYAAITNVCDRLGTYGRAFAIITSSGTDSTGVVSSNAATSWVSPFLNLNVAMNSICKSNQIWYGRSNSANSFIYVGSDYSWMGSGNNTANGNPRPSVWLTIQPYPTNAAYGVGFTNGSFGEDRHNQNIKIVGMHLNSTGAVYGLNSPFNACWLSNCVLNLKPLTFTLSVTNGYVTGCTFSNMVAANGIAGPDNCIALMRDNLDATTNGFVFAPHMLLSFKRPWAMTAAAAANVVDFTADKAITRVPHHDLPICAFNDFRGVQSGSQPLVFYDGTVCTNGGAIVQNIFEIFAGNNSTFQVASGTGATGTTNLLIWNNIFCGNRSLVDYNDTGTSALWHIYTSLKNNFWDWRVTKSDTFSPASGSRTGNWATVFGVGIKGDISAGTTNRYSTPQQYNEEFYGVSSGALITLQTNWPAFTTVQYQQAASMSGMGDYHVLSQSPSFIYGFSTDWVLPYDLDGFSRGGFDPPGVYASGNPRKGAGFFQ